MNGKGGKGVVSRLPKVKLDLEVEPKISLARPDGKYDWQKVKIRSNVILALAW